jgi:predicted ATP-grasp superfamily ATP-dependent carboligase
VKQEADKSFMPERRFPDAWLIDKIDELGLPRGALIFPVSDEATYFASRNHERLSRNFVVACAPWPVIQPLWDKRSSFELARKVGIDVPEFYTPRSRPELEETIGRLDFTDQVWMIRQEVTASVSTTRDGQLTSPGVGDAVAFLEQCLEVERRSGSFPMIAEVIPGSAQHCIGVTMVITPGGSQVVRYCTRRIEIYPYVEVSAGNPYYPGGNVLCETFHDEEALTATDRLLAAAEYHGTATVEFRRHARTGRLVMLKFDPRINNQMALGRAIGQDEALAAANVFEGVELQRASEFTDGVTWVWAGAYFWGMAKRRKRMPVFDQLSLIIRQIPRIGAVGDFSLSDPQPFFVTIWRGIKIFWRTLLRKL